MALTGGIRTAEEDGETKAKSTMEVDAVAELSKERCRAVLGRIRSPPLCAKLTESCKRTLQRLATSELDFLLSLSSSSSSSLSLNIGQLEAIIYILQQSSVTGVSRVCKSIPLSTETGNGLKEDHCSKRIHVDIVCIFNREPVWFIVSDRNKKHISWDGSHGNKGLRARVEQVLDAARSSLMLKPSSVILFFSKGLGGIVRKKIEDQFEASDLGVEFSQFDFQFSEELEDEWVNVHARSYHGACVLEIKVDDISVNGRSRLKCSAKNSFFKSGRPVLLEEQPEINFSKAFYSVISEMKVCFLDTKEVESARAEDLFGEDLINFDTTALIALVSGISNGGTHKLLAASENELRHRFKSSYDFVFKQVMSELDHPILVELANVISGKMVVICGTVLSEFKELVLMCGGPDEKLRAEQLVKYLMVVPDHPSTRMMGLPTTRKLALKSKVIFGTGDHWHAPTLTANMGFVRAVSQTGMSLSTIEHRPRALTGD